MTIELDFLANQKRSAKFARISVQAFQRWNLEPVKRVGREALYDLREVAAERHRRKRSGNGKAAGGDVISFVREDLDSFAMDLCRDFVTEQLYPALWSHPDLWAGVVGFAVDEQKLSKSQAWNVFSFVMIQMIGALADGFQKDRAEFQCKMPDWFGELKDLGKEKFLAKRWPEIERLNAEWHRRNEASGPEPENTIR